MRRLVIVATVALAILPLAGCIGGGGQAQGDAGPSDATPSNVTEGANVSDPSVEEAKRPSWSNKQWFEYEVKGSLAPNEDFQGSEARTYRLIGHPAAVFEGIDSGYVTGTDDKEKLLKDLFWGDNPFLGQISEDFNPADSAVVPEIFDWPLEDGKTWTTTAGTSGEWTFTAERRETIETRVGNFPGYFIKGTNETNWRVFVWYTPAMDWFSTFMLHDQDNDMVLRMELVDSGKQFSGTMYLGEITETVIDRTVEAPDQVPPVIEFEVGEETTDLHFFIQQHSDVISHWMLFEPDGDYRHSQHVENGASGAYEGTVKDPEPGTWRLLLEPVGTQDGPVQGSASVRLTKMQFETMEHS